VIFFSLAEPPKTVFTFLSFRCFSKGKTVALSCLAQQPKNGLMVDDKVAEAVI